MKETNVGVDIDQIRRPYQAQVMSMMNKSWSAT